MQTIFTIHLLKRLKHLKIWLGKKYTLTPSKLKKKKSPPRDVIDMEWIDSP